MRGAGESKPIQNRDSQPLIVVGEASFEDLTGIANLEGNLSSGNVPSDVVMLGQSSPSWISQVGARWFGGLRSLFGSQPKLAPVVDVIALVPDPLFQAAVEKYQGIIDRYLDNLRFQDGTGALHPIDPQIRARVKTIMMQVKINPEEIDSGRFERRLPGLLERALVRNGLADIQKNEPFDEATRNSLIEDGYSPTDERELQVLTDVHRNINLEIETRIKIKMHLDRFRRMYAEQLYGLRQESTAPYEYSLQVKALDQAIAIFKRALQEKDNIVLEGKEMRFEMLSSFEDRVERDLEVFDRKVVRESGVRFDLIQDEGLRVMVQQRFLSEYRKAVGTESEPDEASGRWVRPREIRERGLRAATSAIAQVYGDIVSRAIHPPSRLEIMLQQAHERLAQRALEGTMLGAAPNSSPGSVRIDPTVFANASAEPGNPAILLDVKTVLLALDRQESFRGLESGTKAAIAHQAVLIARQELGSLTPGAVPTITPQQIASAIADVSKAVNPETIQVAEPIVLSSDLNAAHEIQLQHTAILEELGDASYDRSRLLRGSNKTLGQKAMADAIVERWSALPVEIRVAYGWNVAQGECVPQSFIRAAVFTYDSARFSGTPDVSDARVFQIHQASLDVGDRAKRAALELMGRHSTYRQRSPAFKEELAKACAEHAQQEFEDQFFGSRRSQGRVFFEDGQLTMGDVRAVHVQLSAEQAVEGLLRNGKLDPQETAFYQSRKVDIAYRCYELAQLDPQNEWTEVRGISRERVVSAAMSLNTPVVELIEQGRMGRGEVGISAGSTSVAMARDGIAEVHPGDAQEAAKAREKADEILGTGRKGNDKDKDKDHPENLIPARRPAPRPRPRTPIL